MLNWLDTPVSESDLVVFPECALSGYTYNSRDEALPHSMELNDPRFEPLIEAASKHNLRLTSGFLERNGDHLFNAYALFGPEGMIGHYRKIHLPHLGISRFVDHGDIPYQIHSAGDAKIGMAICYDCSFPEPMRLLAAAGADIVLWGTNWPNEHEQLRSSHLQLGKPPVFCSSQSGWRGKQGFNVLWLHSSICGPDGVVPAALTVTRNRFSQLRLISMLQKQENRTCTRQACDPSIQ